MTRDAREVVSRICLYYERFFSIPEKDILKIKEESVSQNLTPAEVVKRLVEYREDSPYRFSTYNVKKAVIHSIIQQSVINGCENFLGRRSSIGHFMVLLVNRTTPFPSYDEYAVIVKITDDAYKNFGENFNEVFEKVSKLDDVSSYN